MFFSYFASVVLLSFALYGLWHVVKDIWAAFVRPCIEDSIRTSMLVIVRNNESQIEGMIRHLLRQTADDAFWHEVVIIDFASDDITPNILDRLADMYPQIRVFHLSERSRPVADGVALCQGEIIYVLDFVNRLQVDCFIPTTRILRHP